MSSICHVNVIQIFEKNINNTKTSKNRCWIKNHLGTHKYFIFIPCWGSCFLLPAKRLLLPAIRLLLYTSCYSFPPHCQIRELNFNTLERLHAFGAHSDYVRSIVRCILLRYVLLLLLLPLQPYLLPPALPPDLQ